MTEAEKEQKIDAILLIARNDIINLTKLKPMGKFIVSIEVNMTQGAIGDMYLDNHTRVKYK